jgi:hypothetical protein
MSLERFRADICGSIRLLRNDSVRLVVTDVPGLESQHACRVQPESDTAGVQMFLADTSIRQYRRRDGRVTFRLRSFLMVETNTTFSLAAYLRSISGVLTLSDGTVVPMDDCGVSEECLYRQGVMMHAFWASGVAARDVISADVGLLRIDYHISFTGHPSEETEFIEIRVPVLARGTPSEQMGGCRRRSGIPAPALPAADVERRPA